MPQFDYPNWGLGETGSAKNVTTVASANYEHAKIATETLGNYVNLTGFVLKNMALVEHYQGKTKNPAKLIYVRLEREDEKNTDLHGEHISATIGLDNNRVMGLTRMCGELTGDRFVNHQEALNTAVEFLKKAAPDLMPANISIPNLPKIQAGTLMDFETEPLRLGNIEVHWIDDHKEYIKYNGYDSEVHGMKVKMFIPSNQLWAWVVVDKNGQIETFERDVFWNFGAFRRETQMWLHDKWLEAHNIELPLVITANLDLKI